MNLLPEDLNYIVNRLPTDVRKLMKKGDIYLAGGFIRSCIANEQVNDAEAVVLSKDIAKKIESEMTYPGQIKVTVIRETRAIEYAK